MANWQRSALRRPAGRNGSDERVVVVDDLEEVRQSFRPRRIATLFVAESPPYKGTFFYSENSRLYFRVKKVFGNSSKFLSEFKSRGFYLDDLVLYPINQFKEKRERQEHRWNGVPLLAERIKSYRPAAVVVLMYAIEPMVDEAMKQAGLGSVPRHVTPFPTYPRNLKTFNEKMGEILPKLPVNGRPL